MPACSRSGLFRARLSLALRFPGSPFPMMAYFPEYDTTLGEYLDLAPDAEFDHALVGELEYPARVPGSMQGGDQHALHFGDKSLVCSTSAAAAPRAAIHIESAEVLNGSAIGEGVEPLEKEIKAGKKTPKASEVALATASFKTQADSSGQGGRGRQSDPGRGIQVNSRPAETQGQVAGERGECLIEGIVSD